MDDANEKAFKQAYRLDESFLFEEAHVRLNCTAYFNERGRSTRWWRLSGAGLQV